VSLQSRGLDIGEARLRGRSRTLRTRVGFQPLVIATVVAVSGAVAGVGVDTLIWALDPSQRSFL